MKQCRSYYWMPSGVGFRCVMVEGHDGPHMPTAMAWTDCEESGKTCDKCDAAPGTLHSFDCPERNPQVIELDPNREQQAHPVPVEEDMKAGHDYGPELPTQGHVPLPRSRLEDAMRKGREP